MAMRTLWRRRSKCNRLHRSLPRNNLTMKIAVEVRTRPQALLQLAGNYLSFRYTDDASEKAPTRVRVTRYPRKRRI